VTLNLALTVKLLVHIRTRNAERIRRLRQRPELPLGSPAPDFSATCLDGTRTRRDDYSGAPALFVFLSPECSLCRAELPELMRMSRTVKRRGTAITLVSHASAEDTSAWLDNIRRHDGVAVDVPVIAAPEGSAFAEDYNPSLDTPYFCLLDAGGKVQSRSLFIRPEWQRVKRELQGANSVPSWMS
jgi:hypothetical protein